MENKQVKRGSKHSEALRSRTASKEVAVIHCRCHPKEGQQGGHNCQRAALGPSAWHPPLTPARPDPSTYSPVYTKGEAGAQKRGFRGDLRSWGAGGADEHGHHFFPKLLLVRPSGRLTEELTPGGALYSRLAEVMVTPGMNSVISCIVETHPICTTNNPNTMPSRDLRVGPAQTRGVCPGGQAG